MEVFTVRTSPGTGHGPGLVGAGLGERLEDLLPAAGGVPPAAGLEHQRALRTVGDDEAVDEVVDLTPVAAALVQVTHQFLRARTVLGILQPTGKPGGLLHWVSLAMIVCVQQANSFVLKSLTVVRLLRAPFYKELFSLSPPAYVVWREGTVFTGVCLLTFQGGGLDGGGGYLISGLGGIPCPGLDGGGYPISGLGWGGYPVQVWIGG